MTTGGGRQQCQIGQQLEDNASEENIQKIVLQRSQLLQRITLNRATARGQRYKRQHREGTTTAEKSQRVVLQGQQLEVRATENWDNSARAAQQKTVVGSRATEDKDKECITGKQQRGYRYMCQQGWQMVALWRTTDTTARGQSHRGQQEVDRATGDNRKLIELQGTTGSGQSYRGQQEVDRAIGYNRKWIELQGTTGSGQSYREQQEVDRATGDNRKRTVLYSMRQRTGGKEQ